jgi:site-specific DNA-methyltransferase (adenine-specific)
MTGESLWNTIHQGDCITGLAQLPAETVHLAFADPPFNIGYEYDVYKDNKGYETYLAWTRQWMAAVCRALQPTGTFWVAIGDEYAAEIKLIAQKELGLTCRSWVIWYYTFGVNCKKKFSRSHVHLFHFVKDHKRFTFNGNAIAVPSARQLVYNDGRANPGGRLPDDTWILRPQDIPERFTPDQDTWYFPRVAGTFKERAGFHGCQMPEQLLGRIIACCSHEGEIVLDPFAGSGTTLVVARKLGRQWIGFELSKEYAAKATARVQVAYKGQSLQGAPQPLRSAPATPSSPPTASCCAPRTREVTQEATTPDSLLALAARSPESPGQPLVRTEEDRAIIVAYVATNEGFSTDRVLVDPELNERFLEQCRKFGIPGKPVDWNRALMRLRKAGKLQHLPAARRTTFSAKELDQYIFASEIAMRLLSDGSAISLDQILCDPQQVRRFDRVAQRFAPGYALLQYRWAALTIRKYKSSWLRFSQTLEPALQQQRFSNLLPIDELEPDQVMAKPGAYLVSDGVTAPLYVGKAFDLGSRLKQKFEQPDAFQAWSEYTKDPRIGIIQLDRVHADSLYGLQARLIGEYHPDLNLRR